MRKNTLTIIFIASLVIIVLLVLFRISAETHSDLVAPYPVGEKVLLSSNTTESQLKSLQANNISESVLGSKGLIKIGNNTWETENVVSMSDKVMGLSNRKHLATKSGMLFIYNSMTNLTFWMKDMLIPIDMIFFDNNWKIVLIETNLQSSSFPKTFGSNVLSQYVLEINALESKKYDLRVGDQAVFLNK